MIILTKTHDEDSLENCHEKMHGLAQDCNQDATFYLEHDLAHMVI